MITYGKGEVLFDGNATGFEMRYKGTITITNSPDNLLLGANIIKIIGITLDGFKMQPQLFEYIGKLRILSCHVLQGDTMVREQITLQGVDYWELDKQKWEDDGSKWGTDDGTYLIGAKQKFDKKKMIVNNNINIQDGLYQYEDGTLVDANELIHIHGDGTAMTGGVHTEDSIQIYPVRAKQQVQRTKQKIKQTTTTTSSGAGSGGGY